MADKISLNGSDWLFKGYIGEDWIWRNAFKADTGDTRGWQPASVPGSVQNDLWQAGLIPDPYYDMNSLAIEWVPERTWIYKKVFNIDQALQGKRIRLAFEGVDYSARFYLNGEALGQNSGMFLPAVFEIGEKLRYGEENLLIVVIDPAPFEQPQIGYTSKVYTQKSRMNYWWDFCPRVVHQGIWQDVSLLVSGPTWIEHVFVQPKLSEDFKQAGVRVTVDLDLVDRAAETSTVEGEVLVRRLGSGKILHRAKLAGSDGPWQMQAEITIDRPELWWPNGAGAQNLYEAEVIVRTGKEVTDTRRVTFGIRKIEFTRNTGAGENTLPYCLVVNGRTMYIRGWNWVPADVLYGTVSEDRYRHLLNLAQRANVNMLRVWGGGLIEREVFYGLCDRLGILVWQEFIQSSSGIDNFPSEDPQFIQFLLQNAEQAIRSRRNHASLAVWCGGNELHYAQDRLCDESHPALAALGETVRRLDPGRHWTVTSPAGGVFGFQAVEAEMDVDRLQDVHGPWEYQGLRKQYAIYNQGSSLLHSEFGVEGLTNRRALDRTVPPERQWPVSLNNPVWEHLGAWWVKETLWQEVFGDLLDLDVTQRATQFIQADGLRYALEADRRRSFHNGGTLPWQFNEPYPMAACTSAVDYYGEPKPSYYAVGRAYQPVSITARFDTLAWSGEKEFVAEAWCSNQISEILHGELVARVVDLQGKTVYEKQARLVIEHNQNKAVMTVHLALDQVSSRLFFLDLVYREESQGQVIAQNRYLFSTAGNLAPILSLPEARVTTRMVEEAGGWQVELDNSSDSAAMFVWLEQAKEDLRAPGFAYFEDNYFCLLPGERRRVLVDWENVPERERGVRVSGWNFKATV